MRGDGMIPGSVIMMSDTADTFLSLELCKESRSTYSVFLIRVVVVLLFYAHGKHLRSCRDGQLT